MRCPTLPELPPPPRGKTGWPWTIESKRLPEKMPDGRPWPRISIVTPSYNQGRYIEETIRSVLLQGYPDLEYIIMDGGSTDGAVDVIRKYEHWLTHWQSGPDGGQGAAINAGFRQCTGLVANWLNSDDYLNVNALMNLATAIGLRPFADIYTGGRIIVTEDNAPLSMELHWQISWLDYAFGRPDFPQEASFFKRALTEELGGINETLTYVLDVDWYERILHIRRPVCCIKVPLSTMRLQPNMKTVSNDPKRLEEYRSLPLKRSHNWCQLLYAASGRFRQQLLLARLLPSRQLIPCHVVRYDGWQDRWIAYELSP